VRNSALGSVPKTFGRCAGKGVDWDLLLGFKALLAVGSVPKGVDWDLLLGFKALLAVGSVPKGVDSFCRLLFSSSFNGGAGGGPAYTTPSMHRHYDFPGARPPVCCLWHAALPSNPRPPNPGAQAVPVAAGCRPSPMPAMIPALALPGPCAFLASGLRLFGRSRIPSALALRPAGVALLTT
jgi:hypothetical protein